jgi:uncharacterized protein YyaL (SSP411 family)
LVCDISPSGRFYISHPDGDISQTKIDKREKYRISLMEIWVILQKVAIFIFQIQKNKTVIGTSVLNSKHSNNIKESEKNMFNKKILSLIVLS